MSDGLTGKVIVVTGAGNGLGRDFALALAAHGARVVVNDLGTSLDGTGESSAAAESVVAEITAAGGQAVASTDSVASWDGGRGIIATAVDAFGQIDGVVNNAGITRDRFFFKMSEAEWTAVINVHLNGTFFVSRAAAPYFKEQGGGAVVNITSTSGLIGNLGQANYAAAKLGIVALTRTIATDMQRYGVRANAVAPFAWTRMTQAVPDTPEQAARIEGLRRAEGAQVAPLVCYLLSDLARAVTGQVFVSRGNEVFVMSQSRPLRSAHTDGGWTVESLAARAMPALAHSFYGLDKTADIFSWEPW